MLSQVVLIQHTLCLHNYSQQNTTSLSIALEILCFFSSDVCFVLLLSVMILFRKWTVSHKTHTFNNYCVTAQHFSVIQMLPLKILQ